MPRPPCSPLPLIAACLLMLSGCSEDAASAGRAPETGAPSASPVATPAASTTPSGGARSERASSELFEFAYAYPAAAGAIPALKAQLDAELDQTKAALVDRARAQQAEAAKEGFPYRPLGSWTEWKVVADLPGWLSLSADISDYQGGAHPNHGYSSLIWDRQANRRRAPLDLFESGARLSAAIRRDFCAALDRQRAKKRGEPVPAGSTDTFDRCIDPVESTIIVGSSNGATFDRIGVLVAPYAAGPYAEGGYEVTLPVTAPVLTTVKPEFRRAFTIRR